MLASTQCAGLSWCGPVAASVTVASQISRPSCERPIDETARRSGCSSANAWSSAVSSSLRRKRSIVGTPTDGSQRGPNGMTAYDPAMATLVILRHGESTWNRLNLFTGWHDVPLSDAGRAEAVRAGEALRDEGLWFDVLHTSVLTRAVETANLALDALGQPWLPVRRTWRLNERHYGALQGLDKKETAERHGAAQTKLWRRSYDIPPPPVGLDNPEHPIHDRRYRRLPPDVLPATECLADVVARVLPYWHDAVVPELRAGLTPLVVAHGN